MGKINFKIVISLFAVVVLSVLYSASNIPTMLETDGASCYQGITKSIIELLLTVCSVLCVLSIIAECLSMKILARMLITMTFSFWLIWGVAISTEHPISGAVYFFPFLLATFITMVVIYKRKIHCYKMY
ncbi:MAG: hypothetical protein MUF43_14520 [Flavobacterium sp.]|nr:hypothetical protein [Flavobacterium sp.]